MHGNSSPQGISVITVEVLDVILVGVVSFVVVSCWVVVDDTVEVDVVY